MQNKKNEISYCIGANIGTNFREQEIEIDPEVLYFGIRDSYNGERIALDEEQRNEILTAFQAKLKKENEDKSKTLAMKNLKEGREFLEKNKQRLEVICLDSGVQIEVIANGPKFGDYPEAGDELVVHYRGIFIDGTEFDSSYSRGVPAMFMTEKVIPGLSEALENMKIGDRWRVYIPPELAYGESGSGPVAPNTVLIFEVELIAMNLDNRIDTPKIKM